MKDFSNEYISHKKSNSLEYLQFNSFNETGLVKHCITTRKGGVSTNEFNSLNLGVNTSDNKDNIQQNFKIICDELGINYKNIVRTKQIHSDIVKIIEKDTSINEFECDGLITNIPGIPLFIVCADCVPLLFLDPVKKVIAASHAGWKGTVNRIGNKTVLKMKDEFGCNPSDILVGIGPSIGQCCFETDSPFDEIFSEGFGDAGLYFEREDKFHIDLWKANKIQLEEVGIKKENLILSNICTACNNDYFYSHRGDNAKTGRFGAIIELK